LQKLKIVPKDRAYIDPTISPVGSPRIKSEGEQTIIKREDADTEQDVASVERDTTEQAASGGSMAPSSTGGHSETAAVTSTSDKQPRKKRKAQEESSEEVGQEKKKVRFEEPPKRGEEVGKRTFPKHSFVG
jgi:hypothetical protein